MKSIFIIIFLLLIQFTIAQSLMRKPDYIRPLNDSLVQLRLVNTIDDIYSDLIKDNSIDRFLVSNTKVLTRSTLEVVKTYHNRFKEDSTRKVAHQLSNIIPISKHKVLTTLHGFLIKQNDNPILLYSIKLLFKSDDNTFKISIPLEYKTRFWKTQKVGSINYHYRDSLHVKRAEQFNAKNQTIANNFGLKVENLEMYMCYNYQDILDLRGIVYTVNENGVYRDGYGVVGETIFSVMNNEDFSHDMVHYYSSKINKRKDRNWITEEGLAYYWGNAYYTDAKGEMIEYIQLKSALKRYMSKHPNTDLFQLFKEDIQIFKDLAPEISTRSVIAAIIVEDIEKTKGIEGLLQLINAGRMARLKNFLRVTNNLIGLNTENFNNKFYQFLK